MRHSSVRFSSALLAVVLLTGILAPSAFAMTRDRDPENPITRVIKFVRHLIIHTFDEQIGVPKP